MSAQHTPGPWMAEEFDDEVVVTSEERIDIGAPEICIMETIGEKLFDDEQKANARLIAAAPDLLDALKSMMLHKTSSGKTLAIYRARAAIAKTTNGETK